MSLSLSHRRAATRQSARSSALTRTGPATLRTRTGRTVSRTVAVIVVGMLALAGCSNEDPYALPSDITPVSETPAAPASPTADKNQDGGKEFNEAEAAAIENAKNAVTRFFEVSDAAFRDPENAGEKPFYEVAINPVRSDELGQLGYFLQEGLHSTGSTVIEFTSVRSAKAKSDPENFVYPKVVFDICVDVSTVEVLNKSGESIQSEGHNLQVAVVGVYEEPGEGWFVEYLEYDPESNECDQ